MDHELIQAGERALHAGEWETARARFEAAVAETDAPEALDGLAQALWFLGEVQDAIVMRERVFERFVLEGRCDLAARAAVWVSHQHMTAQRESAARGWVARAERALAEVPRCAGHGWVAVERTRHASSIEERLQLARRAMEIAREHNDRDLEVYALSLLGRAEVAAGRRQQGMQLLEEAMAAGTAGDVRNLHTLGEAYCNLLIAATAAGDWERVSEWCEMVDDFARSKGVMPLFGACRTVHANVLLARGRWPEAEDALEDALQTHARYVPAMAVPTTATMAELRVRQGRLAEAEQLLRGREEHPVSLRALALLRIAEGRPRVAAALLERGLIGAADDALREAELLAPLVDARLACGDVEGAHFAASRLEHLSSETGSALAAARAHLAAARVSLAEGRIDDAAEAAQRALAGFSRLAMPLDTGEARLELARSVAAEMPELALEEARTAFATFQELGAARAMDAAAAVLRELGAGSAARPRAYGELTTREQEVLELLARGMTNALIARTLFISEKTAGHHVSRILSKLGVRNRAEAAAYAARSEIGSG